MKPLPRKCIAHEEAKMSHLKRIRAWIKKGDLDGEVRKFCLIFKYYFKTL